jgi:hypothetical protein
VLLRPLHPCLPGPILLPALGKLIATTDRRGTETRDSPRPAAQPVLKVDSLAVPPPAVQCSQDTLPTEDVRMPPPLTLPTTRDAGEFTPERQPADKRFHPEPSAPSLPPDTPALPPEDVSMAIPLFLPQVRTAEEEGFTPDRTHCEKKSHVEDAEDLTESMDPEPALVGVTRLGPPEAGSDPTG